MVVSLEWNGEGNEQRSERVCFWVYFEANRCSDRWQVRYQRRRGIKDTCVVFSWSTWKDGDAVSAMGRLPVQSSGGRPVILSRSIKLEEAIRCQGREAKLGLRGMCWCVEKRSGLGNKRGSSQRTGALEGHKTEWNSPVSKMTRRRLRTKPWSFRVKRLGRGSQGHRRSSHRGRTEAECRQAEHVCLGMCWSVRVSTGIAPLHPHPQWKSRLYLTHGLGVRH